MNDPIDIRTKKKLNKYEEEIQNGFDKALVFSILEKNFVNNLDSWVQFQQKWCNNAFSTFKDYDKYLVLIYLFQQVWQTYADKFQYFTIEEFYSREEWSIEKINLIQIAADLKIPKESIRRKINEFQKEGILVRDGKKIILNKAAISHQKPNHSLGYLCNFIHKHTLILQKESWFGVSPTKEEIKAYFEKYYTVFWLRFFKLQIPFLVRWRELFSDLETWNVWGVIAINHQHNLKLTLKKNTYDEQEIKANEYYNEIIKAKVNYGINASSISDISHIPRATVIRKLKWLTRHKLIKKNKELEYLMRKGGKTNEKTNEIFILNRHLVLTFVSDIIDLIKNSKFEI